MDYFFLKLARATTVSGQAAGGEGKDNGHGGLPLAARRLAVRSQVDLLVLGGGLAGFIRAVEEARTGKKVFLGEPTGSLGGEVTRSWQAQPDWEALGAVGAEIAQELERVGAKHGRLVDPPACDILLDRLAEREGVEVLYWTFPVRRLLEAEGPGALLYHRSGEFVVRAGEVREAPARHQGEPAALRFVVAGVPPQVPEALRETDFRILPALWGQWLCQVRGVNADITTLREKAAAAMARLRQVVPEAFLVHLAPELEGGTEGSLSLPAALEAGRVTPRIPRLAGKTLTEVQGEALPLLGEWEVLVAGGGTAGAVAAITAARAGARTLLVEPSTMLGGIGTGGGIHDYYYGLGSAFQEELDRRTNQLGETLGKAVGFSPEAKKIVLARMAAEAGVEVWYRTTVVGALVEEDTVRGAVILRENAAGGPSGYRAVLARVTIDATGEADLLRAAGAETLQGRHADGFTQPYSLVPGRLERGAASYRNYDAGWLDPTDGEDLSRAQKVGKRLLWRDEGFTAENRAAYLAPLLGVRQGPQIVGDYALSFDDLIRSRTFADAVTSCHAHYDNHALTYESESPAAQEWTIVYGFWRRFIGCQVPFRCLLPRGLEWALVACRALSVDHDVHNCLRMQRDLQRIGEVAGLAAARAAGAKIPPRRLDREQLCAEARKRGLLETAANLRPEDQKLPQGEDLSALSGAELRRQLRDPDLYRANDALFHLVTRPREEAASVLREELATPFSPASRHTAALGLGLLGEPEAIPVLVEMLRRRVEEKPRALRTYPRWLAAVVLLGRLEPGAHRRQVLAALRETVERPDENFHHAVLGLYAYAERAKDTPTAADRQVVRDFAQREDFSSFMSDFSLLGGDGTLSREPLTWLRDLAAARSLRRLGETDVRTLVQPYLGHQVAYVRRWAERLLAP